MAVLKQFSDVLQDCAVKKKTGALFVAVAGQSENLVRFFFKEGDICNLSYGPAKDAECLDILECYDFGKAVYFDGMKPPAVCDKLPPTKEIIARIAKCGKQVMID